MLHQAKHSRFSRVLSTFFAVLLAGSASAAVIPLGDDWEAVVPDDGPITTIETVDYANYLFVHIHLTFTEMEPSEILIRQAEGVAYPVPNLALWESIHNRTNTDWTAYNMDLIAPAGEAYFYDSRFPALFPFETVEWVGDWPFYSGLRFSDPVAFLEDMTFSFYDNSWGAGFPLRAEHQVEYPIDFTLRQMPIPEPTTLGLAVGLAALGISRRRVN